VWWRSAITRFSVDHQVDGDVEVLGSAEVPATAADAFTARTGWDPRKDVKEYLWFRVRPRSIEARHGEHEMPGRWVMRDGRWAEGAHQAAVRESGPAVP
jgi:hypothetical protein